MIPRFINESIEMTTYLGLSTRAGGEVVSVSSRQWFRFVLSANCNTSCDGYAKWKYGRGLRTTRHAINTQLWPLASDERSHLPFGSQPAGGAQFVFADGHVSFISQSIDMATYQGMSTIAGNEVIATGAY